MYSVCMSLEKIENAMREKLKFAPQLGAKLKFDLGDDGVLFIDGTQNPATLTNEDDDADTTFVCSADLLTALIEGRQDPTMAFMTGKLKVKGSMGYALKLSSLLED